MSGFWSRSIYSLEVSKQQKNGSDRKCEIIVRNLGENVTRGISMEVSGETGDGDLEVGEEGSGWDGHSAWGQEQSRTLNSIVVGGKEKNTTWP